jgi:hypothetical protein
MKSTVLVVGVGCDNKVDYLERLNDLGAQVIVLEPVACPVKTRFQTFLADFTSLESVLSVAQSVASQFNIMAVDTIFEMTMEHAAEIRKMLGLKGLTPVLVRYGRNKTIMSQFMVEHGIRTAPFIVFDKKDDLNLVARQMRSQGVKEWILKPDSLAGNVGVQKISDPSQLKAVFEKAQADVASNPDNPWIYYPTNQKWMVGHYIHGHEIESEICIHNGRVIFEAYFFKTLSVVRPWGIEENRVVTPIPWLSEDQKRDLHQQIQNIGLAVWEDVMKPCDKQTMVLHPEFRIDAEGRAFTLEFAFRNGGGLNPYRILETTGVDPYELSARATLGLDISLPPQKTRCASGYQILFSDRPGIFESLEGIEETDVIRVQNKMEKGFHISVPQSEPLARVTATAPTPEEVERILNEAMKKTFVVVDGHQIGMPVSGFVHCNKL